MSMAGVEMRRICRFVLPGVLGEEMVGQQHDVGFAIAQRRHEDEKTFRR